MLEDVYKRLEQRRSFWRRWTLARQAEALNTIRLDYEELTERTHNAIKFLGDMYYARAYRLAATRIGVNDYRELVAEKLETARDLYESMVNQLHQGRAFFLEMVVIIILMIEIVFLFRGAWLMFRVARLIPLRVFRTSWQTAAEPDYRTSS